MELTQESFLLACRAHKQLDPERPLAPWLFQIARNLAYKEYNRRKKQPEVSLERDTNGSYLDLPVSDKNPHQESVKNELLERINRAYPTPEVGK